MKNLSLLLLSATLAGTAAAQDALDAVKPFLATKVTASVTGEMGFKGSDAEFDMYSFELRTLVAKPIELPGDFQLLPLFRYQATFMDFKNSSVFPLDDEQLHTFQLPLYAVHYSKENPWIYGLYFAPSLSTDFGHGYSKDFFFDAGVGAGYRFSDSFMFGLGLGVFDITGDPTILPGIGLVWKPSECFSVELLGPTFSATYYAGDNWRFSFDVRYDDNEWNVSDQHASNTLEMRSVRAGLSAQRRLSDKWWLEVGGGISFDNRLDLKTPGGLGLDEAVLRRLDNAPYGYISVRREVW